MATRTINKAGLDLVKSFEGLKLTAYLCPANVPTIGYGSTTGLTRADVGKKKITLAQAETLLRADLMRFETAVSKRVKVPLTDNQFAALVSWTYNLGEGNLASSTLLKRINAKAPIEDIERSWLQWVNAGGKPLAGVSPTQTSGSRVVEAMSNTLTIQLDGRAVLRDLYVFLHTNEFEPLMDIDNENANLGPIVGQDYLVKAIICTHVYERLRGYKWRGIGRVGGLNDCFADVEFQSKADAMLWKLANP